MNLLEGVKSWHYQAPKEYRTIEDLCTYLEIHKILPPALDKLALSDDAAMRLTIKTLARILAELGLDFTLSPLTVDALVRPPRFSPGAEHGYDFFLSHYHEHPWIMGKISLGANSLLRRIQITPVYPSGGTYAWIYDPWTKRKYLFGEVRSGKIESSMYVRKHIVVASYGPHSQCTAYYGKHHPFHEYMKRLNMMLKGASPTVLAKV